MKKKIWAIVVIVLLAFNLYHTMQLRNEMQNAQNNILSQVNMLNYEVQNIESNVRYELEQQTSLITDSSWFYGDVDYDSWEVSLICSITAKEYQPGVTEAVLVCADKEYPMTLRNGKFEATVLVPVWEEGVVSSVQLHEDGKVQTENLNWHFSPMFEIMSEMSANLDGQTTFDEKEDYVLIKRSGSLYIDLYGRGQNVNVNGLYVVAALDGEEVQRINLQADETELESYHEDAEWNNYRYELKQDYEVPYGSELEIYVEYVDQHNLHYQMTVDKWSAVKDGEGEISSNVAWYSVTRIYDEEGNLLWGGE